MSVGIRTKLAVCLAKFSSQVIRRTRLGRGTTLPGRIAEMLAPELLQELSGMVREKVIVTKGRKSFVTGLGRI